jgi:hypothetical protein
MPLPSTSLLVLIVLFIVANIVPAAKILQRMGYSRWWAVLVPISPLNIIGLWVLAFARWPADERSTSN